MRNPTLGTIACSISLIAILSIPAAAVFADELYRWRDDNGVMQYTQTPPPPGVRFKHERTTESRLQSESGAEFDESGGDTDKAPLAKSVSRVVVEETTSKQKVPETAAERAEKQAQCAKARDRLDYYKNTPAVRMTTKGEDGRVSRLTDEQHSSRMQQFRSAVDRNC